MIKRLSYTTSPRVLKLKEDPSFQGLRGYLASKQVPIDIERVALGDDKFWAEQKADMAEPKRYEAIEGFITAVRNSGSLNTRMTVFIRLEDQRFLVEVKLHLADESGSGIVIAIDYHCGLIMASWPMLATERIEKFHNIGFEYCIIIPDPTKVREEQIVEANGNRRDAFLLRIGDGPQAVYDWREMRRAIYK